MSRKTIPFPTPQKPASAPAVLPLATVSSRDETKADRWVAQLATPGASAPAQPPAPKAVGNAAALTITISDAPDMFELWKIGVFLPYALAWRWAFGAASRSARAFAR
jgi:hypothetical protein